MVNAMSKPDIDLLSIFFHKPLRKVVQGEREAQSGKVSLSHGIAGAQVGGILFPAVRT